MRNNVDNDLGYIPEKAINNQYVEFGGEKDSKILLQYNTHRVYTCASLINSVRLLCEFNLLCGTENGLEKQTERTRTVYDGLERSSTAWIYRQRTEM